MGKVYHGIPTELALRLKDEYKLKVLVETGTYVGRTAVWGSKNFETVYTIESDYGIYFKTVLKLHAIENIVCFHGYSQIILPIALRMFTCDAMIWLDAHWSKDLGYTKFDAVICPVLDEIKAIAQDERRHIVLIDDMRLFGKFAGWPTVDVVRARLEATERKVFYEDDVIVAVPV